MNERESIPITSNVKNLKMEYLILYGMRYKKEYACCQSYARTSAVMPDMGHAEKERGESLE